MSSPLPCPAVERTILLAYELAVIVDHGTRRMIEDGVDEFYYVTLVNESYAQPSLRAGDAAGIIKGLYRIALPEKGVPLLRLLGSGAILREVIAAQGVLLSDWDVCAEVWSVTSFSELARDARATERWNRLHPDDTARRSYVEECLGGDRPIVAATDYVRAFPQSIAPYLAARFVALGTDGFGRSDTRSALRRFFEVDRYHIVVAALHALAQRGDLKPALVARAIERYRIDPETYEPWLH